MLFVFPAPVEIRNKDLRASPLGRPCPLWKLLSLLILSTATTVGGWAPLWGRPSCILEDFYPSQQSTIVNRGWMDAPVGAPILVLDWGFLSTATIVDGWAPLRGRPSRRWYADPSTHGMVRLERVPSFLGATTIPKIWQTRAGSDAQYGKNRLKLLQTRVGNAFRQSALIRNPGDRVGVRGGGGKRMEWSDSSEFRVF